MARGKRRRAARQAAREEAETWVESTVARSVGQGLWYLLTAPVRLLLRAVDAWF